MISEVTGVDSSYCIPDVVWDRIITLLSSSIRRRRKKKTGRPRMDDRKAMSAISTSYVQAVSGMLYLEVLVLQVQYMTDSRNGERLVFSSKCGSMDWLCTDKKTGIDWKWQAMDGVITKAPLGGKKHRTKSHRQS